MMITYSGPYSDFFTKAFFDDFGDVDIDVVSASSTEIVLENLTTGALTTLTGTGFSLSSSASPLSGTITGMSFEKSGSTVATMANFSWGLVAFDNSLTEDGGMDMASLLSAQPITIDASGASTYFDMEEWAEASPLITSDMTITGTPFNDQLIGGAGNDTINPGANYGNDQLYGTAGNDAYDFINADDSSYYEINYAMLSAGITVNIDGAAETGSVSGADGTDTFLNLGNALTAGDGGFSVIGTTRDDVFNVTAAPGTWIAYGGGAGNDTFNLTVDESTRLFYNWDGEDGPDQGLVMNLATGVVSNDGLGYSDQVNVLGGTGRLEIRATDFNDSIIGSDRRESFILEQGNDTLDGGGGVDRVRYDRSGVDAVVVDLDAGTATGAWDGNGFTHLLSNIEYVRGSYFDDALLGSDGEDTLKGRAGNDTLSGRDGDDRLYGEGGNDSLIGGLGRDRLYGGDGDDTLDGSAGDATTEGKGDYMRPGLGSNTIIGNATLWEAGKAIDLSYGELSGIGGMLVTVGQNGHGTAQSGTAGYVSDTFTYVHYVEGSREGDILTGGHSSGWRGWAGLGGDDTINGGDGTDRLDYRWDVTWLGGSEIGVTATFTGVGSGSAIDGFGDTDTFTGIEEIQGTEYDDRMTGQNGDEYFIGRDGNDTLDGGEGNDTLNGGDGNDTLIGNEGDDVLIGGESEADLRDVIYGGDGNDSIDGGYGNDELRGDNGDDTVSGGFGTDTVIGADGNDVLTGEAWSDMLYGGAGNDFLNGGFGYDRMNGGTGADRFFHLGIADHGSDWIQDYTAADGDVLVFGQGSATADQFQVNFTETANAGVAGVEEAFIIYRPTGQIMWALVDGAAQEELNLLIAGVEYDLLA